ncbi:MAG: SGNH/GDSL hydrolase family protein [Oscillospiraceae bacterium]|nr:SGNH/GDSL hydrolase family protein [Oscillospiraceae bacterium]
MRILMLGNSFTYFHNMPGTLAAMTGAEVVRHTRGGAYLSEHLNSNTELGAKTQAAFQEETWDYVVLQEMSSGPITAEKSFHQSIDALCAQIRANGATPLLYATWAYQRGGEHLKRFGMDYDEMFRRLYEAYHAAAERNHCPIADVGERFYQPADSRELYFDDSCHPSPLGSQIAAEVIAQAIKDDLKKHATG